MGTTPSFFRKLFLNPLSITLITLNTVVFAFALMTNGVEMFFSHPEYQPMLVYGYLMVNFPSLLVAGVIVTLTNLLLGLGADSLGFTFSLSVVFIASVLQWAIIGWIIFAALRYSLGGSKRIRTKR